MAENATTIGYPSKARWGLAAAGLALLLVLGLIYAWSIFVTPLEKTFGWSRADLSLTFSVCMSMFCLGGVVSGFLSRRLGPRFILLAGALMTGGGFWGAAQLNSLAELYFYYGGLVGFGVGLSYNAVLGTVLKWFPDRQGLVSGFLLMGFGFGSLLLSRIGPEILGRSPEAWRGLFQNLAWLCSLAGAAAAVILRPPAGPPAQPAASQRETGPDRPAGEMLRRPAFWLFFAWASILTAAGLMVIGHAAPLAISLGASAAAAGWLTGLVGIANGLGRVTAGFLFDRFGRRTVMSLAALGFILAGLILTLAVSLNHTLILAIGFGLAGLAYGSLPPTNSAVISQFYGLKNYPLNFSLVNSNIVLASFLGPYLSGVMRDASGSYLTTFAAIMVFGVLALGLERRIKKP